MAFKADPFGAVIITSLGSLGMKNVWGPHNLATRVTSLVSIC